MSYRDEYLTYSDYYWDNVDEIRREMDERWETMSEALCLECSRTLATDDDMSAGLCIGCRERLMQESA